MEIICAILEMNVYIPEKDRLKGIQVIFLCW